MDVPLFALGWSTFVIIELPEIWSRESRFPFASGSTVVTSESDCCPISNRADPVPET